MAKERRDALGRVTQPSPPKAEFDQTTPETRPGDPEIFDPYEGMTRGERDIAILSEGPTQGEIDAAVAQEEQRVANRINDSRILRGEERRLEMDPTVRMGEGGVAEQYPDEVNAWMDRNASQYDMEMRGKYPGGDVPLDRQAEADARLYATAQRQQREALRDVAIGAGLSGPAQSQFEAWKNNGGRWPGAYTSMDPAALRAAQQYYLQFGKPRGVAQAQAGPSMTMEEFQQRQAAGEFDQPLSIPEGARDDLDAEQRSARREKQVTDQLFALAEREAARRGMSVRDLLGERGSTPENLRAWRRSMVESERAEAGRAAAIRAIMRRDPENRKAQLGRVNQNLPAAMRISPSEVGLPEGQAVGRVRQVEDISELSMQTAMEGEYISAPQGMFRIGRGVAGLTRIPVQRINGRLVPNADSMSEADFSANYSPSERRSVTQMIASSGSNEYSEAQRNIRRDRARISGSDSYTEAEKQEALAELSRVENKLHYQFLQNEIPGDPSFAELATLPEMSQQERYREAQIAATLRRAEPEIGGFVGFGDEQQTQTVAAQPSETGESRLMVVGKELVGFQDEYKALAAAGSPDAERARRRIKIHLENNWNILGTVPPFNGFESAMAYYEQFYGPGGPLSIERLSSGASQ